MWIHYFRVCLVTTTLALPLIRKSVCEWGKYGKNCNLTCPRNCALVPRRNLRHCHRLTGTCSEGCQSGWHGNMCDKYCSTNCLNKTCIQQSGHCIRGCYGNNTGLFCNSTRECGRGWYGDTCEHPCSSNCVEERCQHTTGVCILGCRGTYTGEFCNTAKETSTTPAAVNNKEGGVFVITIPAPVFLVAAVGVALAIVAASVLMLIIVFRWRRHVKRWWRLMKCSQRPATADGEDFFGDFPKEELQTTENSPLTNIDHGEVTATSVV